MTREHIEAIVREWQRRLNIAHWRIVIDWETQEDPEVAYARVSREGGAYEGAKMTLEPNYEKWDVRLANEIIAHELIHMLLDDMQKTAESAAEVLRGAAAKLFTQHFMHELEGVVDKFAVLLVQFAGTFDPEPTPAREETTYEFSAA